ncbi:hypothetical protein MTR_8g039885 [Medicago truncatula]|uniref:Uncharacterized protein n=1 Tax=Medicago truncatula TaxID=3880 RepID=A0A072TPH4_MEDTR|nr:hypothetical protein MTR_8g039885 [Medicago truncatula]
MLGKRGVTKHISGLIIHLSSRGVTHKIKQWKTIPVCLIGGIQHKHRGEHVKQLDRIWMCPKNIIESSRASIGTIMIENSSK